jgi:hypothetical protein
MKVCSIFSQISKLFSRGGFEQAVKQHKTERHARGFTSWGGSHAAPPLQSSDEQPCGLWAVQESGDR